MSDEPCPVCRPGKPCSVHRTPKAPRGEPTGVAFHAQALMDALHASGAIGLAKLLEKTPRQLAEVLEKSMPEPILEYLANLPTEGLDKQMQTILRKPQWERADLERMCGVLLARLVLDDLGEIDGGTNG